MADPPDLPIETFFGEPYIRQDLIAHVVWRDGSISRLATTFGGLRLPADAIETTNNAFYASTPAILDLPPFRSLVNGVAEQVGISLSDVGAEIAALSADNAELADGAIVNVGRVYWDRDWKMIGGARWGFAGQGGEVRLVRKAGRIAASGDVQPNEKTIEFTISSQLVLRSGSYRGYWTAPQHKVNHPTDEIFSQLNKISIGYNKTWPRF